MPLLAADYVVLMLRYVNTYFMQHYVKSKFPVSEKKTPLK